MGVDDGLGSTIDDVGVYPYIPTYRVDINGQCGCQNGYFSNEYHL